MQCLKDNVVFFLIPSTVRVEVVSINEQYKQKTLVDKSSLENNQLSFPSEACGSKLELQLPNSPTQI